jgi:hypothetical protein
MTKQAIAAAAVAAAMGLSAVAVTDVARADGIFNAMNPFNWFFGRDSDDYRYRRYGYGPYGWGGPYGWNGPWGGPGYAAPQTVIVVPESPPADRSVEVASARLPE